MKQQRQSQSQCELGVTYEEDDDVGERYHDLCLLYFGHSPGSGWLAAYGTKLVELLTYYGRGATRPRARLSLLKACAATASIDRRTEETGMEI